MKYSDGEYYEGDWKEGVEHGKGVNFKFIIIYLSFFFLK